ncbi:hypothetical protein GH733_006926, partial [Mirounga leonina]
MEYCRGQAYIVSSGFSSKMKTFREISPSCLHTLLSCALNMWLAKSLPVVGVSVVLGTIEEVCSFFHRSPQLLLELDNVISVLFQNNEEKGKELKEICHSQWTGRHDAFEVLVDLLQALVLCLDASSLTAVLHSLNEVMENIESYYQETLSVPTVEHIIQELKDIFSEQHLKALKCLSLVPSVMGQLKFNTSEEHHADMYRSDLPNPDTLSAELHCWRIKWKHRGKDIELPSTIYEAQTSSFFPNVYALLKVLCILPVMKVENERYENGSSNPGYVILTVMTEMQDSRQSTTPELPQTEKEHGHSNLTRRPHTNLTMSQHLMRVHYHEIAVMATCVNDHAVGTIVIVIKLWKKRRHRTF